MSISPLDTVLPFYHTVSDEALPHIKHLYSARSVKQFEEDLDVLLKKYKPVSLFELKDIITNQRKKKKVFHLSFDDGLSQCHSTIAPVLKKKGIPATFFLNSAFLDNAELFYRFKASLIIEELNQSTISKGLRKELSNLLSIPYKNDGVIKEAVYNIDYKEQSILDEIAGLINVDFSAFLEKNKPYMESIQAEELKKDGFTIGSHSIDHPYFYQLKEEEQLRQLTESTDFITSKFRLDYKVFAFPFTDFNVKASFFEKVFDKNKPLADLTFGSAGFKKESFPFHLQRLPMEKKNNSAEDIIGMETWMYKAKKLIGKHKIRR